MCAPLRNDRQKSQRHGQVVSVVRCRPHDHLQFSTVPLPPVLFIIKVLIIPLIKHDQWYTPVISAFGRQREEKIKKACPTLVH